MRSNDQVTAATSPGIENGPNLLLMNGFVDRLGMKHL